MADGLKPGTQHVGTVHSGLRRRQESIVRKAARDRVLQESERLISMSCRGSKPFRFAYATPAPESLRPATCRPSTPETDEQNQRRCG